MQKLTKQQANWLIDTIHKSGKWLCPKEVGATTDNYVTVNNIKELINQCTEKEFPKLNLEVYSKEDVERDEFATSIQLYHSSGGICYEDPIIIKCLDERGMSLALYIPPKKFFQFAEGVNKIADWIREEDA